MLNWSFFIFTIHRHMSRTRQTISLSFILSGYIFFKLFLVLWLFSLLVDKQNSHMFLIFFWWHFNLTIWAGLGKTAYSLHYRHICLLQTLLAKWLVWFFLFVDSTFPLLHIMWDYWPIGIQPSNHSLVARILLASSHTHIRETWPKFNSSDFSSTSAGLWENNKKKKKKKRERERVYIYE